MMNKKSRALQSFPFGCYCNNSRTCSSWKRNVARISYKNAGPQYKLKLKLSFLGDIGEWGEKLPSAIQINSPDVAKGFQSKFE